MKTPLFRVLAQASLALVALSSVTEAGLLRVGPGHPFATIQEAVDAASDGDVVLVETGTYGPLVIDRLGAWIVADFGATVSIRKGTVVRNQRAKSEVVLKGLELSAIDLTPALDLVDNQGAVRVEDCSLLNPTSFVSVGTGPLLCVTRCDDVAVARTTLSYSTGATIANPPEDGTVIVDSTVALYDSSLLGRNGVESFQGNLSDGSAGLSMIDSRVFASGCTIQGGKGATGVAGPDAPNGGAGLVVDGASSVFTSLNTRLRGGGPGAISFPVPGGVSFLGLPGPPSSILAGSIVMLPGSARRMRLTSPVREGESRIVSLEGLSGDMVFSCRRPLPVQLYVPALNGVLVAYPRRLVQVTMLKGTGLTQLAGATPFLPDGEEVQTRLFQPLFVQPDGTSYLGTPTSWVILDESL